MFLIEHFIRSELCQTHKELKAWIQAYKPSQKSYIWDWSKFPLARRQNSTSDSMSHKKHIHEVPEKEARNMYDKENWMEDKQVSSPTPTTLYS